MKLLLVSLTALLAFGPALPGLAQGRKPGGGGGAISCPADRAQFFPATSAALQAALDCADPGATITLNAGPTAVYQGNFTLRRKPVVYDTDGVTPKAITIRSAALADLPDGTRVGPAVEASLAWLQVTPGSTAPVLVTELKTLADGTRAAASHYRLEGIKLFTGHWVDRLVRLGTATETLAAELPVSIVFDRSYFAGSPAEGTRQGLVANANDVRVTNSYFRDFKDTAGDAQAIIVWNGAGPFSIDNNYLEASGENVMFGGGDPSIEGLVPADITVTGNHVVKPTAWVAERSTRRGSSYRKPWRIKNLFELKNAERVRVAGNVFENNWIQADQRGFAIVLTPRNQSGSAPWSHVRDVTFRDNLVRNTTAGFNLLATDDAQPSGPLSRVLIENNLLLNVAGDAVPGTDPGDRPGRLFQILNPAPEAIAVEVTVRRNTAFSTREVSFSAWAAVAGFQFASNVVRHNPCVDGNDCGIAGDGTMPGSASLTQWFRDPLGVSANVLFDAGHDRTAEYPAGNEFPGSVSVLSDCLAGSATIDQRTGLATGATPPHYTAVDAACQPLAAGVDWDGLKPLVERAISGRPLIAHGARPAIRRAGTREGPRR